MPRKPRGLLYLRVVWLRAGAVLLVLALLVVSAASSGVAEESGSLAVVLGVDTSGSMKKTDPRNLRREASRLLVSLLRPEDRVALVTFDTRASVPCPLESASRNEGILAGQIDRIRSDGKFTNLHDGLRAAHEAFSALGSRCRKAIVFLTDGKMDTGDPGQDLRLTEALLGERVPRLSEENIPVYAIAFSPFADAALLDRIATATGGFFYTAQKGEDLHGVLLRIYRQMARPDALPTQGKTFLVDPSVREMTIVVSKTEPESTVGLRAPGGRRLNRQEAVPGIRWFAAEAFEMITVESPEAGTWEIGYRQEAAREVFILTDLSLRSSFRENAVARDSLRPVEVWLEEKGEKLPTAILETQGVEFLCELEPEGQEKIPVRLRDDGLAGDRTAGDGVFAGSVQTDTVGTCRLIVLALGKTFERRLVHEFRVFEPEPGPRQPEAAGAQVQSPPDPVRPEGRPEAADREAANVEPPISPKPVNWKIEIAQFFLVNSGLAAVAAAVFVIARSRKKRNLPPVGSRS